jgi:hypothetical protein
MRQAVTNRERPGGDAQSEESAALALRALAWTVAEPARADRLLALTGLDPAELRARLGDPALLAAAMAFLEGHEADLLACADALGVVPAALVAARAELEA